MSQIVTECQSGLDINSKHKEPFFVCVKCQKNICFNCVPKHILSSQVHFEMNSILSPNDFEQIVNDLKININNNAPINNNNNSINNNNKIETENILKIISNFKINIKNDFNNLIDKITLIEKNINLYKDKYFENKSEQENISKINDEYNRLIKNFSHINSTNLNLIEYNKFKIIEQEYNQFINLKNNNISQNNNKSNLEFKNYQNNIQNFIEKYNKTNYLNSLIKILNEINNSFQIINNNNSSSTNNGNNNNININSNNNNYENNNNFINGNDPKILNNNNNKIDINKNKMDINMNNNNKQNPINNNSNNNNTKINIQKNENLNLDKNLDSKKVDYSFSLPELAINNNIINTNNINNKKIENQIPKEGLNIVKNVINNQNNKIINNNFLNNKTILNNNNNNDNSNILNPTISQKIQKLSETTNKIITNNENSNNNNNNLKYIFNITPNLKNLWKKFYVYDIENDKFIMYDIKETNFIDEYSSYFPFKNCKYVQVNDCLYVSGGSLPGLNNISNKVYKIRYDNFEKVPKIEFLTPMNKNRENHGIVYSKKYNALIAIGGLNLNDCEIFYLGNDKKKWELLPSMNEKRSNTTIFIINENYIFVVGGFNIDYKCSCEVLNLEDKTRGWIFQNLKNLSCNLAYSTFGCIIKDNRNIILLGGFNGGQEYSKKKYEIRLSENYKIENAEEKEINGINKGIIFYFNQEMIRIHNKFYSFDFKGFLCVYDIDTDTMERKNFNK